jgi:hypothetical protein
MAASPAMMAQHHKKKQYLIKKLAILKLHINEAGDAIIRQDHANLCQENIRS